MAIWDSTITAFNREDRSVLVLYRLLTTRCLFIPDENSPMDTASGQAASESQRTMKNNGPWLSNDRDTLQIDSEQPQIVPGAIFAQVDPDNIPEQPQLQQESPMVTNFLHVEIVLTEY
jgi:hypothetical protein